MVLFSVLAQPVWAQVGVKEVYAKKLRVLPVQSLALLAAFSDLQTQCSYVLLCLGIHFLCNISQLVFNFGFMLERIFT